MNTQKPCSLVESKTQIEFTPESESSESQTQLENYVSRQTQLDIFDVGQKFQILLLVPNFRNQLLGVEYLMNRFNLQNDKYLEPVYKEIANNIQTPGDEWNERFNNKN